MRWLKGVKDFIQEGKMSCKKAKITINTRGHKPLTVSDKLIRRELSTIMYEKGIWEVRFVRLLLELAKSRSITDAIRIAARDPHFKIINLAVRTIIDNVTIYKRGSRFYTDDVFISTGIAAWKQLVWLVREYNKDQIYKELNQNRYTKKQMIKRWRRKNEKFYAGSESGDPFRR